MTKYTILLQIIRSLTSFEHYFYNEVVISKVILFFFFFHFKMLSFGRYLLSSKKNSHSIEMEITLFNPEEMANRKNESKISLTLTCPCSFSLFIINMNVTPSHQSPFANKTNLILS